MGKYLDTSGNEQEWVAPAAAEAAAAEEVDDSGYLAYVNPFAWYRYIYSSSETYGQYEMEARATAAADPPDYAEAVEPAKPKEEV